MKDERYDRSADMRLLALQREALGIAPRVVRSTSYADLDAVADRTKDASDPLVPTGAILIAALDAQPRTALIPGALVTVSMSVTNEGGATANAVRLSLALPPATAYRPGTLLLDGIGGSDSGANELTGNGLEIGEVEPGARRTLVVKLLVEAGVDDILLTPHLTASSGAVLGSRALRLKRAPATADAKAPARPFYESDEIENASEPFAPTKPRLSVAFLQPPEYPQATAPRPKTPARSAAKAVKIVPKPVVAAPVVAAPVVAAPVVADPVVAAPVVAAPVVAAPVVAEHSIAKQPVAKKPVSKKPITKQPITKQSAATPLLAKPPRARPIVAAPSVAAPSVAAPSVAAPSVAAPSVAAPSAAAPAAKRTVVTESVPKPVTVATPFVPSLAGAVAGLPGARPRTAIKLKTKPLAGSPANDEAKRAEAEPAAAGHAKIEVVRSPERSTEAPLCRDSRGGPMLTLGIDRKRLATLNGLFGGPSLGMIAHYLVLNALAATDALPGDAGDGALAAFAARQEQLLSRALIATRLGKAPPPDTIGADLPPIPAPHAAHARYREIARPPVGTALLIRAFAPAEMTALQRAAENDSSPPFLRAAQLFVGLCANDAVVAETRERRATQIALSAYAGLATAEITRIFLRAKLNRSADVFRSTDPTFDDAARAVLAALGRLVA